MPAADPPEEVVAMAIQDRATQSTATSQDESRRLSGAPLIVEYLIRRAVPYVLGPRLCRGVG